MTATSARALVLALPRFAGLVLVPTAVRVLMAAGDTLEQAHATLDALDAAGVIELRPDGAAYVEPADRDLCPVHPFPGRGWLTTLRVCDDPGITTTRESAKEARS